VQDRSDNKTRFVIIGTTNCKPTGIDKTSIYFTSKHQSGSLCKALSFPQSYKPDQNRIQTT
jgi:chorismate mutase/prephenate dehydratase